MNKKQDISRYILNNQDCTVGEVANDLNVSADYVRKVCRELGIKLTSEKERNILYIKLNPDKSVQHYSKRLKVESWTILGYLNELDIEPVYEEKKPGYRKEYEDGMMGVLADVVAGFTPEQKRKFAENYL